MSVPGHGKRGEAAQPLGDSAEVRSMPQDAVDAVDAADAADVAGEDEAPAPVSRRLQAMLDATAQETAEMAGDDPQPDAPDAPGDRAAPAEAQSPSLRASRDLRTAISEPPGGCAPAEPDIEPERAPNRAASLALRLGSMMGVVIAGVFVARLFDFALGLQTRLQGLGVLAVYLVVLAVILAPGLHPRTRKQWIVVIGGFAGVIIAIAMGSAFARLMLQTKDFQNAGLAVEIVVEFGVMFAFWGLALLAFVRALRAVGLGIGVDPGPSGQGSQGP
jgi:hypothetical protein